jgi:hypothetical protein
MKDFAKWENTRNGAILALIATIIHIPSMIHFFNHQKPFSIIQLEKIGLNTNKFIIGYIFIIFVILLISSIFGFAWSKKYGAKGFGSFDDIRYGLIYIIISGVFSGILFYLFYTKKLYLIAPDFFPKKTPHIIMIIITNSVFEEILFRFGILSWWLRIITYNAYSENKFRLALLASIVSCTIITINQIYLIQGQPILNMLINLIILNLIFNFIQHIIYIKYGLLSSILSHIISYIRFVLLF